MIGQRNEYGWPGGHRTGTRVCVNKRHRPMPHAERPRRRATHLSSAHVSLAKMHDCQVADAQYPAEPGRLHERPGRRARVARTGCICVHAVQLAPDPVPWCICAHVQCSRSLRATWVPGLVDGQTERGSAGSRLLPTTSHGHALTTRPRGSKDVVAVHLSQILLVGMGAEIAKLCSKFVLAIPSPVAGLCVSSGSIDGRCSALLVSRLTRPLLARTAVPACLGFVCLPDACLPAGWTRLYRDSDGVRRSQKWHGASPLDLVRSRTAGCLRLAGWYSGRCRVCGGAVY